MWDRQTVMSEPAMRASEPAIVRDRAEATPWTELLRTAVTAVLFALLVTWMFTAWWSAPRASDIAELDHALSQGEVTGYIRASGLDQDGRFWASGSAPNADDGGHLIVWQTESGRTYYVDPGLSTAGPPPDPPAPEEPPDFGERRSGNPSANAVEQRLRDAGVRHVYDQGAAQALGTLLVLGGLFVLINGATPRRGTRWFWFWVGGVTAGLGVLAWLLLERVWPAPSTRPESQRLGGWAGFGLMILISLVAAIAVGGLREAFGPGLIPG